jgi:hypothetical protein
MALFKSRKKYPTIEEIDIADEWAMFQGQHQGNPLIARFRTSAKDLIGHPSYTHQVGIAVPLNEPDHNGFPSADESKQLDETEDQIACMLETGNESLLVGIISTNGMREFVLYTTSPEEVRRKFKELNEQISTHALQLMIRPDNGWNVYKQFIK